MKWSCIDLNFPWIGSIAAVVLLILLFSTNRLRSGLKQSRWRDLSWLSWLAAALYLIHNVEEYGVDLLGQFHAFPQFMCATLAQPAYPSCPIPAPFYLAVNLPLFWVGAPVAAILSRRHPILGLSVYGVIFVNALTHLGAFVRSGYNPGVLTALILFLPVSFWVARVCFWKAWAVLRSTRFYRRRRRLPACRFDGLHDAVSARQNRSCGSHRHSNPERYLVLCVCLDCRHLAERHLRSSSLPSCPAALADVAAIAAQLKDPPGNSPHIRARALGG
jgi:hypothetical protein